MQQAIFHSWTIFIQTVSRQIPHEFNNPNLGIEEDQAKGQDTALLKEFILSCTKGFILFLQHEWTVKINSDNREAQLEVFHQQLLNKLGIQRLFTDYKSLCAMGRAQQSPAVCREWHCPSSEARKGTFCSQAYSPVFLAHLNHFSIQVTIA